MTTTFDWQGRVGDVWADEWRRTDRSFADLSPRLDAAILAAAPARGKALDMGCGAGGTSLALADARPDLAITGIDLSPALIAIARNRAAGRSNLRFEVADGQRLAGEDAGLIFSRHGVMFFADPVMGLAALRAAAMSGGRLVFSCFAARADNRWARVADAAVGVTPVEPAGYVAGPFAFSDPGFTRAVLQRAGWTDATPQRIDFDYVVGAGEDPVADGLDFMSRIGPAARALADASPARREEIAQALRALLDGARAGDRIAFPAAAWIWTATAGDAA